MSQLQVGSLVNLDGTVYAIPVQRSRSSSSASSTTTTAMPADDTIPQNTEGAQFLSASITPKSATSILKISVVALLAHSTASMLCTTALFQDSTANALAATCSTNAGANGPQTVTLVHYMTSGTTNSTTFSVRCGGNTGATLTFNGSAGTRLYGGVAESAITIEEFLI